jgi:curved DNA-binding protein CbpA
MDDNQIAGYLELFDLQDSFTEAQLKQAYHDLVQVWHPDKHAHNEADDKMKEINQAYQALESGLVNGVFRFERSASRPGSQASGNGPAGAYEPPPTPHSQTAEGDAQDVPHAATAPAEPGGLSGNAFWLMIIGVILLVVITAPHGKKPVAPDVSEGAASVDDQDLPLSLSIEGPVPGTNVSGVPISKDLDSKNGFKALQFGMPIDEARRRLRPDRITTNQYNQVAVFWYGAGASNTLGDLPLEDMNASFFRGRLFKIEVSFTRNPEQIFDALHTNFGPSCVNDTLTRGPATLRAQCWFGEKVFCAIVAPRNSDARTGWDAMVMYDQALYREAQRYAQAEPARAAQALSEEGFGEFKFGMTLKAFSGKLRQVPSVSEAGIGQREAVVSYAEDSKLGPYRLSRLRASFFQDRLFRIELDFDRNQQALNEGFMSRFPAASDSGSWSRNGEALRAKQFAGPKTTAAILAPRAGSSEWDAIVLLNRQLDERRSAFEHDAPKRAAKDF